LKKASIEPGSAPEWSGAGGDPYAAAITANPYNILPEISPDDTRVVTLRKQMLLQRQGLNATRDLALRTISRLPLRLAHDTSSS